MKTAFILYILSLILVITISIGGLFYIVYTHAQANIQELQRYERNYK